MSAILVPGTEEYLKARMEAFKKAGLSTEAEKVELVRIAKPHSMTKDPINQALQALIGSSGIDENQAKTSLFYAVATHLLPDKLDIMPALAIIGPSGTGKTPLLRFATPSRITSLSNI